MMTLKKQYITPISEEIDIVSTTAFLADNLGSVRGEAGGSTRDEDGDDYTNSGSVSGSSIRSFGEGTGF